MWSCDTIKNCRYFCLDFPLGPKYPFSVALILRLQLGLLSIKPDPLLGWVKARMSHARSRDEREEHSWIRTETHIRRMLCLVPLLQLKGSGNTDKTCGSFQKSASAYCGLELQVMLPLARSSWSQIYLYVRNATKKETEITETFTVPHPSLLIQQDTHVLTFLTHPRCFLYDLLVSPLDTAVSLEQIHSVTVHVPEHLNLHMSAGDRQMEEYKKVKLIFSCERRETCQGGWKAVWMNDYNLGSSTNFSTSMTSSLKDFLASRLADSNCSRKSESDRAIRIP